MSSKITYEDFIEQYNATFNNNYKFHIGDNFLYYPGFLDMEHTNIKYLPNNLHINGSLDVRNSFIVEIPSGLQIKWNLYINGNIITEFPDDIIILESIHCIDGDHIKMSESAQINLIKQRFNNFYCIKKPTRKAKTLQKLLWQL